MSPNSINDLTQTTSLSFDSRIAEGSAHLSQLERMINNASTSPLLRLPRELQAHIFLNVATSKYVWDWIFLGQICSALRSVLLSLGRLWGGAIYSWPTGLHRDELLARAGPTAPLDLIVTKLGPPDAIQFAREHLHRARVLGASVSVFVQQFVQNPDSISLPYLEEVTFLLHGDEPISAFDQPPRDTPKLKEVMMGDAYWNFRAPALTSLELRCTQHIPPYTASQLFDLLQQNGRLRNLRLEFNIPSLADEATVFGISLHFPYMETMFVIDNPQDAVLFWSTVSVPLDAQVHFIIDCGLGEFPPTFRDSALFKRHLGGRQCLMLEVRNEDGPYFGVLPELDVAERAKHYVRGEHQPTLRLNYKEPEYGDFDATVERAALNQVCAQLNLSEIKHFRHSGAFGKEDYEHSHEGPEYEKQDWTAMLSKFRQLEHLEVEYLTDALCGVLASHQSSNESDASLPSILCPCLKRLTVNGVREQIEFEEALQTGRAEGIRNMMQSRSDQGWPLDVLCFRFPTPDSLRFEEEAFLNGLRTRFPGCSVLAQ